MSMRALHHVGLGVRDLDRSVAFYHDVLGLSFELAPTEWFEGPHLQRALGVDGPASLRIAIFRVGDGQTWLELLEYRQPPSPTERALPQNAVGAAHVALFVDDIRATVAELHARGVTFNSDVNVIDDGPLAGWRWVYFRDPDGHTLELVEVAYVEQGQRDAEVKAYVAARRSATSKPQDVSAT
jgi:catechol 2,3-dioxygenase-like lactoylglutathione lyase family enzyme